MGTDYVNGLLVCPTCEAADFEALSNSPVFPAVRCATCGLGIERRLAVPGNAYDGAAYAAARDNGSGGDAWLRWHHDVAVGTARVSQLRASVPRPDKNRVRWTDVGCGAGAFLAAAGRAGYTGLGVEVDPATVTAPVRVLSYRDWVSRDPVFSDVVSFFDVLEHLPDPTAAVRTAEACLVHSGDALVVEVPDLGACDDFDAWPHRRITDRFTEHVYHFTTGALKAMVKRYAPRLDFVAASAPVPGKIQAVWRRGT
jgi:SAM-dependent methyltransferase